MIRENSTARYLEDSQPLAGSPDHWITGLSGYAWRLRCEDEREALAIAQKCSVPEIVARILAGRGITAGTAEKFLNPTLREYLTDPSCLKDMDKAVERLRRVVESRETIAIFGDYDVDGATSSALLVLYFRTLGIEPLVYIPDRMNEGYGPNVAAFVKLAEQGAKVIITVDCGTMAHEAIAVAQQRGVDVVVLDHHQSGAQLPEAHAVVNPNRLDEAAEYRELAAVGVTFLFLVALNRALRMVGYFSSHPEPDLLQWLDIVALGTVCDVVPLTGLNRALVTQGLRKLAERKNPGLCALGDVAGLDQKPGVYHLGFVLGPRINAGGRVGQSDLGVRLLTCEDATEAHALAEVLHRHNAERQAIESMVLEQAMRQAHEQLPEVPVIFVQAEKWHHGVIGIVAGRLKERFEKPVAVVAMENGIGKASARSVTGVDFGAAVTAAKQAGLLLAGGGHAMAAGFTVEAEKIPALQAFLAAHVRRQRGDAPHARMFRMDGYMNLAGITPELASLLERAGPFGAGNPPPRLVVRQVCIVKADVVGENHVRVLLTDGGVAKAAQPARLHAIAFRAMETPLGQALLNSRGRPLDLLGQVRSSLWQGQARAEFHIEDIAFI